MTSLLLRRGRTVLLALLWLAVVGLAVYLAVTRYAVYGYAAYLVPAMALVMLVLFALAFLPKAAADTPLGTRLGQLATGGLILLVLILLGVETLRRWRTPFTAIVLGGFFLAFLGIFRDWLRAYLHPGARPSTRTRRARGRKRNRENVGSSDAESSVPRLSDRSYGHKKTDCKSSDLSAFSR